MEVIIAENAGYCYGVNRAIDMTNEVLKNSKDKKTYALGPIVHNPQTINKFSEEGLITIENISDDYHGNIITRSHGIHKKIVEKIKSNDNMSLIDTTCPLVKNVQNKVEEYHNKKYQIIIIGDSSHPEVISINSFAEDKGIIINSIKEAKKLDNYDKICIVSQTTNRLEHFNNICDELKNKSDNIELFNTICNATSKRQESCESLSKTVDMMIVIGGYNSSNTNKLAEVAKKHCDQVYHIEVSDELPLQNIKKINKIGITAGASTPDWIIKEVTNKMNSINNNDEMMEAIENSMVKVNRGDIIRGEIIYVTDNEVMVNINYKSDGIIYKEELSNDPQVKPKDLYKQGEEIDVYVVRLDDGEGNVLLSTKRLEAMKGWEDLEELFENNTIVDVKVLSAVKGGLSILVNGLTGFMPASQISVSFVDDLSKYKDKEMKAKIIDLDKSKNRIILSRKVIEKKELDQKRDSLWANLEKDTIVKGTVARLTDFGAFIDLGGLDGLAHISDLSWARINHPSEVVKEGQEIEVKILDLDKAKNRISLGYKQIQPKPWDVFMEKNKVGDIVEGEIVNVLDFGGFVRLGEDVDGLVHVSQISEAHVNKPSDVLAKGDKVEVKIMEIDVDNKKISLSIKEAQRDKIVQGEKEIVEEFNETEDQEVSIEDQINIKESDEE